MTIRQSLTYNKHLFKSDGPCPGKLKAQKQKALLVKLKADLRVARSLHRIYRKAAVGAVGELKLQLQTLQDELAEEKALALEALNDRAEVVGDLMKRAAPEGWEVIGVRYGGTYQRQVHRCVQIVDGAARWYWNVYIPYVINKAGETSTLDAAVKAAEAVVIPKVKKTQRR